MAKTPAANAVLNPKARYARKKQTAPSFRGKQLARRGGRNLWMKLFGKQYAAINN